MKADLHNHTTASDGILTVQELANYAKSKGVDIIAITDHDSVSAFNENLESLPIMVIKGVELSTYLNGENIHLLGYFINNDIPDEIKNLLKHFEIQRKERVNLMISKLKEHYNLIIEYENVKKYADGVIGRPHVAKAIEEKYNTPFREIFDKYIGNDQLAYVPTENFGLKEAIDTLHRNNAIAVLAHPILIKKNKVEDIISLGIDGIEAKYSKHDEEDVNKYIALAKKHNLLVTGGSDFHRYKETDEDPEIGQGFISGKYLKEFLERLNIQEGE